MNKHLDNAKEFLGWMKLSLIGQQDEGLKTHLKKRIAAQEWLIEQAKRVQELEKDIKEWEIVNESWEEINTHLVEQNKRYLGALKFYADEKNYEDIGIPTGNNPPALPILEDRGQVARKELEGGE